MTHTLLMFLLFLKASLFSFGGFGPLPMLRQDFVEGRHWATDDMISTALAVGRISPGPNGLFLTSLGYFMGGLPGALAATLASAVPPFLILGWAALHRRLAHLGVVAAVTRGIGLAVVGLIAAVGAQLVQATVNSPLGAAVAVLAGLLAAFTRVDALYILGGAALAGILATAI